MSRPPLSAEEHAVRRAAYHLVNDALKAGELVRPVGCEDCPPLHGHHHLGYDHPLDVVWLCPTHHAQAHARPLEVVPNGDYARAYLEWRIELAEQTIGESRAALAIFDSQKEVA